MGGARACALRVAVRCEARVEVGTRGLAAGRARASFAMGLRIFLRAFEMNSSAISGVCGTQGGWWQLLGEAPEHWACSLTHMLSGDMRGTTWGDEEGTVPPEPQFAKLCEFTRGTSFDMTARVT